ncbi:amidase [Skermanella aerolata]|uniref:Amidase n=2 Tax=Skermanella aerolata TaxID=393310 RepID=A0A512DV12_9PROT|nr:amidase [Skermanella aerolata]KJB95000.1 amidase [Skermanella aerolata KACC 11604]GEO40292.1 amidase [Skermanella aerolata]
MSKAPTIAALAADLAGGRTTSVALTEAALDRIADPAGEGVRTFTHVDRATSLAQAEASDRLRAHGIVPSPLAGLPVSVKDLFDLAGQVTTAGSVVLKDSAPAKVDAPAMARLRAAGAVLIGRTNMTEFAFSGLGINPHYGTPGNPFDRKRIPGGSSSGAAVSVADGMAVAAIGSDTGGSVRIPAALCGLAGFKPTQSRVPRDGAVPLSWTLDSIGPLAASIACCAVVDAVMAGEPAHAPEALPLAGLRIGVPEQIVLDGLDATVSAAFSRTLTRLSQAGAHLSDLDMPALIRIAEVGGRGGFAAPEALAWHKSLLEHRGSEYDPRVSVRIRRGAEQSAVDYIELLAARKAIMAEAVEQTRDFDALLLPTTPIVAPRFDEVADDAGYTRLNIMVLRNPSLFNFLDRPAVTLPCTTDGLPVGAMLVGKRHHDRRLLAIARAVEPVIAG